MGNKVNDKNTCIEDEFLNQVMNNDEKSITNTDEDIEDISKDENSTDISATTNNNSNCETRDTLYTDLLAKYVEDYGKRIEFKNKHKDKIIKQITVFSLIIIFILGAGLAYTMIFVDEDSYRLTMLIGFIGSLLSTLIIIPKIIVKYIFPPDEDSVMTEMIKAMQLNDEKIRSNLTDDN